MPFRPCTRSLSPHPINSWPQSWTQQSQGLPICWSIKKVDQWSCNVLYMIKKIFDAPNIEPFPLFEAPHRDTQSIKHNIPDTKISEINSYVRSVVYWRLPGIRFKTYDSSDCMTWVADRRLNNLCIWLLLQQPAAAACCIDCCCCSCLPRCDRVSAIHIRYWLHRIYSWNCSVAWIFFQENLIMPHTMTSN